MKKLIYTLALLISFSSFGQIEEGITYYESGAIKSKVDILDYELDEAKVITYYESGVIKSEELYMVDVPNGECIYYYESGEFKEKGNYVDGELQGEYITYYSCIEYDDYGSIIVDSEDGSVPTEEDSKTKEERLMLKNI